MALWRSLMRPVLGVQAFKTCPRDFTFGASHIDVLASPLHHCLDWEEVQPASDGKPVLDEGRVVPPSNPVVRGLTLGQEVEGGP